MIVKDIVDEDFTNYKKPSMFIATNKCNFKCCKENGNDICQNSQLIKKYDIDISINSIIKRYLKNNITKSIVFGGLEPFDTFSHIFDFIKEFRKVCNDDIVIYSGYYLSEIEEQVEKLKEFENIIIKFGRFIPNQESHFDNVLGVELANKEQYAVKVS